MKTINDSRNPFFLSFLIVLLLCCCGLHAKPMNSGQARQVVRKWLEADPLPLGAKLGDKIDHIEHFTNDSGEIVYYIVYLQPEGFVIVSADDLVEPIVAFVEKGHYDPSPDNPLGALVSGDIPNRIAAARSQQAALIPNGQKNNNAADKKTFSSPQDKWAQLSGPQIQLLGVSSVSEIWVEPFMETTWGQDNIEGYSNTDPLYSYYVLNNDPIGCVATATAQLMRYHEHGGSYVWSNMPLNPTIGSYTDTQRNAIAQLCFDIAEAIDTDYDPDGSSAFLSDADDALTDTYGYSNSIYCDNFPTNLSNTVLYKMANPNVDAGLPVIFGIRNSTFNYAHAVVCDGYGYNSSTLYHHLNMGWDGRENVWYNLPTIYIDGSNNYNVIDVCVYNVFVSGSGEIISGRVTGPGGHPISDVTVTATGGGSHYATTNANGIYALVHVPSNTSFTVTASKGLWNFPTNGATTGRSVDEINKSGSPGNRWGINFTGTTSAGTVEFDKDIYWPGDTITIILLDNDLSGGSSVLVTTDAGDEETVTLSATSAAGMFTGTIATAQAAISDEDGTVQIDYSEIITVTYNDADNGAGGPATAQDTANTPTMLVGADFTGGLPAGWTIINGGSSSHTWTSTNPGNRSNSNWNGTFMIADSDKAGSWNMDEQLITPDFDCSSLEDVSLKFSHYYQHYETQIGDVDVRVGSGSWQNVAHYTGNNFSGQVELDISSIADGQENVQIRWHFYNANWDWFWGIDNVQVVGYPPAPLPPAKCSIEGYKFDDTDGDGVWDQDELGLRGWEIYLDLNDNGQLDPGEPNTITGTDPNGYYKFSYLDPATYIVAEVMHPDWTQTLPGGDETYTIIAEAGGVYDNTNFGNRMSGSDISAEINLDRSWMYQNLPTYTGSQLTADVSINDDPESNSSYTYNWEIIRPADTNITPSTVSGGTGNDSWTFAAAGCHHLDGLSDSGQTFTVKVTVTGDTYGNIGIAQAQFGIALLGDVNNDSDVNENDRTLVNDFWVTGSATGCTFSDCDLNCDGIVDVADRSIANLIWRGEVGNNSVSQPCPLR